MCLEEDVMSSVLELNYRYSETPRGDSKAVTTPHKRNSKKQTYEVHVNRQQSRKNLFSLFYQTEKCFVYKLRVSYFQLKDSRGCSFLNHGAETHFY